MAIEQLPLPIDWNQPVPDAVSGWLLEMNLRIQSFQDRWKRRPVDPFVPSDFQCVYLAIEYLRSHGLVPSNRFCEWGCGFAVVSCIAAELGFRTTAIEAEIDLFRQAELIVAERRADVELHHGNFLPTGSAQLSNDPTLPSLSHHEESVYRKVKFAPSDFGLIFAYPWPGEGEFLERVFDLHAAEGACLLTFCGPYELRLVRKVNVPDARSSD